MSMLLVICLLMSVFCTGAFASGNERVAEAANGVFLLNVEYAGDYSGDDQTIPVGTCFLINSNTVVTANHVLDTTNIVQALADSTGKTESEVVGRLSYSITISRDVTYPVTLSQRSEEMDFAIMTLNKSVQTATPLAIRNSSDLQTTEKVYAIGFPALVSSVQDINTYTAGDVTITEGSVQKVLTGINATYATNADFIQTSCKLTERISGGPMVDEDGYVVGICHSSWGEDGSSNDYYYAICIDQVLTVCDSLGITYTLGDTAQSTDTAETTEEAAASENATETAEATVVTDISALSSALDAANQLTESDYTPASWAVLQDAKLGAQNAMSADDQSSIDSAEAALQSAISSLQAAEEESSNTVMYVILAVVALIIIAVVILIVVLNGQKKKTGKANVGGTTASTPIGGTATDWKTVNQGRKLPTETVPGGKYQTGGTSILNQGTTETVLLDNDAGNTSLLASGGTLIRKKSGARVEIDRPEFLIGREASKVTYCVSDNPSVGRVHAKLIVRDGATYIMDMQSTNGTFVNGVKCLPNKEKLLKKGDKVKLADEEFEFEA